MESAASPLLMRPKSMGLETGGTCAGNTLTASSEEDFPHKYRPFHRRPVLNLHQ